MVPFVVVVAVDIVTDDKALLYESEDISSYLKI